MRMRMCLAIMNDKGMAGVLKPHHNLGVNARWAQGSCCGWVLYSGPSALGWREC